MYILSVDLILSLALSLVLPLALALAVRHSIFLSYFVIFFVSSFFVKRDNNLVPGIVKSIRTSKNRRINKLISLNSGIRLGPPTSNFGNQDQIFTGDRPPAKLSSSGYNVGFPLSSGPWKVEESAL